MSRLSNLDTWSTNTVIITVAKMRCSRPVTRNPPNTAATLEAHGDALKNNGKPVSARPRKLNMRNPCRNLSNRPNRRTNRSRAGSGLTSASVMAAALPGVVIARLPGLVHPRQRRRARALHRDRARELGPALAAKP
jgi:hypothetical protein